MQPVSCNVKVYYIYSLLDHFTVFLPFIIHYFQTFGLSLTKIALLNGSLSLILLVAEIPSGYIADRFGTRNALIASTTLQAISIFFLYVGHTFEQFLGAYVLMGLSMAFLSGADSALVYDTLAEARVTVRFKLILGRAKVFAEAGTILASVAGTLIVGIADIKATILITLIVHILLLGMTFTFREPRIHREAVTRVKHQRLLPIIRKTFLDKNLLSLCVYSFFIMGFSNTIFLFYQPYFAATGLRPVFYGAVFAVFSVSSAVGAYYAHTIERVLKPFRTLLLLPFLLAVSFIGAGIVFATLGFLFFMAREFARGIFFPVTSDYISSLARGGERATVLSIQSMFSRVGYLLFSFVVGILGDRYGLRPVLLFTGMVILMLTPLFSLMQRRLSPVPVHEAKILSSSTDRQSSF